MSGGRLEEMCIDEGSREKNGSREEGVAGVKGAGESGGGSSLMCASWLSRVSRTGGLLSRSVAWTRKKASTAGCSTGGSNDKEVTLYRLQHINPFFIIKLQKYNMEEEITRTCRTIMVAQKSEAKAEVRASLKPKKNGIGNQLYEDSPGLKSKRYQP